MGKVKNLSMDVQALKEQVSDVSDTRRGIKIKSLSASIEAMKIKLVQQQELLNLLKAIDKIKEGSLVDIKRRNEKEHTRGVVLGLDRTAAELKFCVLIRDGVKSRTRVVGEHEIFPVLCENGGADVSGADD